MQADMGAIVSQIIEHWAQARMAEVKAQYQVGQLLKELTKPDYLTIANDVGRSARLLYMAVEVATAITPDELTTYINLRSTFGLPPTWSHIVVLSRVTSKHRRQQLLNRWLNNPVSVRELKVWAQHAQQKRS